MLSLIIALLIIAVSVYAIVDYQRIMPSIDRFYKQFGRAEKPLKVTAMLLFFAVLMASLYIVLEWVKYPGQEPPTFGSVGTVIVGDAELYADQAGELVASGVDDVGKWFSGSGKKSSKSDDDEKDVKAKGDVTPGMSMPLEMIQNYGGRQADYNAQKSGGVMDFNAGLGQYVTNSTVWSNLYEPKVMTHDGKCHGAMKGTCAGVIAPMQDLSTCQQVTVSPAMNLDSSVSAWVSV